MVHFQWLFLLCGFAGNYLNYLILQISLPYFFALNDVFLKSWFPLGDKNDYLYYCDFFHFFWCDLFLPPRKQSFVDTFTLKRFHQVFSTKLRKNTDRIFFY